MKVLVTGAASGIGRATCLRLAASGKEKAQITMVDIEISIALENLADQARTLGAEVCLVSADMASETDPEKAVQIAIKTFGGMDAIVSNAGINSPGKLVNYTTADWDRLFAVNTRALWLLAKAAHKSLSLSNGAIVAVASMSGTFTHANLGAYSPSKAAVIMLAKVLSQELGQDGIRVNTVSPGMVRTGMTEMVYANNAVAAARDDLVPLGKVAAAEDIADVVVFLLGPDARYINGHDLIVDGGLTGNYLGRLPGLSNITRG